MNTFRLEDCPKLGPYWLAQIPDGRMIAVQLTDKGDLVGIFRGCMLRWQRDGDPILEWDRQGPIVTLAGPWEGKAIIGWTAEEMAERYFVLSTGPRRLSCAGIMQELIDNRPNEPEWCQHIVWYDGKWMMATVIGSVVGYNSVPDSWDECPVKGCHAKRPEGT